MSTLEKYQQKRNFERTPEPEGDKQGTDRLSFVVQKHSATRLHYDFRLEWAGVLKSWAVPKGPSLNPKDKRLAVHVEDHPLDYGSFEGAIPRGEYGGGIVLVWDRGWWEPEGDPEKAYRKGHLSFRLYGEKLLGHWSLIRTGRESQEWLLIKSKDEAATDRDILLHQPDSVQTGRTLTEVADEETEDRKLREQAAKRDKESRAQDLSGIELPLEAAEPRIPRIDLMLPTRVKRPPAGDQWLHEIKYDGYRILAEIERGKAVLRSRRGHDWTPRFGEIAEALGLLPVKTALLDGEVVAQEEDGTISFQALQNAMRHQLKRPLLYYVFDLLHLNGYNTRDLPLSERKRLLAEILQRGNSSEIIIFGDHIQAKGEAVFRQACRMALEGVVSKKADSHYLPGRTKLWLKVKCEERQEFVVGGFLLLKDSSKAVGALLLGYYENDKLVYCGRVGTGFDTKERHRLFDRLSPLEQSAPPFAKPPSLRQSRHGVVWTQPSMVVEIVFSEWTGDGLLRHPSYQGEREDKEVRQVVREYPSHQQADNPRAPDEENKREEKPRKRQRTKAPEPGTMEVQGVRLTNAERVLFPEQGLTKLDLAEYYSSIAEYILPEIRNRPLVLVRCPDGPEGDCFYQKQSGPSVPEIIPRIAVETSEGLKQYLTVRHASDLLGLVQISTLEIHTWGCRADDTEKPDRIVFDLDPDPALEPAITIETALALRDELAALDLNSFVRTTGGKGLHVVVPILRTRSWQEIKAFSKRIAGRVVKSNPAQRVAVMSKSRRHGKVFIDYFRNGRGASAIASYSTRAKPSATVATPVEWEELAEMKSFNAFTVKNIAGRLEKLKTDPWQALYASRQQLTDARLRAVGIQDKGDS